MTCDAQASIDGQRARRTASAALRRALERRDPRCVVDGCDAPPWMLEVHHRRHWADGGATTLANTALVCRFHHGKVFHEGFTRFKAAP